VAIDNTKKLSMQLTAEIAIKTKVRFNNIFLEEKRSTDFLRIED